MFDKDLVQFLLGKTVTISILVDGYNLIDTATDGNAYYSCGVRLGDTFPAGTYKGTIAEARIPSTGCFSATGKIPTDGIKSARIFVVANNSVGEGSYLIIRAIKLELGDHQTLATEQDDGTWKLLDPIPNYQQELAKCMRYFQVFGGESFGSVGIGEIRGGYSSTKTNIYVPFGLAVPMRAIPTFRVLSTAVENSLINLTNINMTYNFQQGDVVRRDVYNPDTSLAGLSLEINHDITKMDTLGFTHVYTRPNSTFALDANL